MTLTLNLTHPQAITRPGRLRDAPKGACARPMPGHDARLATLAERAAQALPLFADGTPDLTELAVLATRRRIAASCRARAGRPRK